jgi:eukaryotic-like serine/threonine-protein kinase
VTAGFLPVPMGRRDEMAGTAADRVLVNRYVLTTPLGRGGMGVVWRAHDVVLGREVAVKEVVFPASLSAAERQAAQARVTREARAAARLNHPGVVTLYDVVPDTGGVFLVMELVEAPTLAELVRVGGPLAPERVAEIGVQLASALEVAHHAGVVHRDVKPANVLVPQSGSAKLADFGVASLTGDPRLTTTGLVIGSPAYMAPEQAQGEATGPPADFWALGATLYFAVEGQPPFDRGSSMAALAAVVNEAPQPMRRAGPLALLLAALLAKDPQARPSGPKVRAWLAWILVVTPSTPPTQILPTQRPGRAGPLTSPASTSEPPRTSASSPITAATGLSRRSEEVPAFEQDQAPAMELPIGPAPVQRPSRPILPPAPPVSHRARRRLLGVAALLLVGGLLGAWLAGAVRSEFKRDRAAPATTSRSPGVVSAEDQATRATARGGAGATGTTEPTPSIAKEPASTRPPTTPTTAAHKTGLPAGWRAFTNRAGNNRVGVPPGFGARTRESYNATVIEEPRGPRRVFTVRSQNPSALLPQASRDYRSWARRNFGGFREVRYAENQTYAGHKGAVVFEYVAVRDGRRVHVSHINVKGRSWGYNIELIVPADQWGASQGLARQFEQAFQPLG